MRVEFLVTMKQAVAVLKSIFDKAIEKRFKEEKKLESAKTMLYVEISVSDPHEFSCGSGSRIPKMPIWIRIQTPNFLFGFGSGSGSKGGKN